MRRFDELFMTYPLYGSRQMVRHLRHEGVGMGRHRVRRLMGLDAIYQAPLTPADAIRRTGSIPIRSRVLPSNGLVMRGPPTSSATRRS